MKGGDREQRNHMSKISQSMLTAQLRVSTMNLPCLATQEDRAENKLMQKMENGWQFQGKL